MDGHFVPIISFGAGVVASMRPHSKFVFDCHLMVLIQNVILMILSRAGADIMTVHVEATPHIHGALQKIQAAGVKAGIVINPGTPVADLECLVFSRSSLIMTVNPGFGGQAFIPETLEKVRTVAKLREEKGLPFDIEVDGGIDNETIKLAKQAGANVFVAGTYLFKGDVAAQVQTLKEALHD